MYLHAFKYGGHPTFSQDDVVLSDGENFARLGTWDGFDFSSDIFKARTYILPAREPGKRHELQRLWKDAHSEE